MPGDNTKILDVARSLRDRVDAPVLGGIAVYLHGYLWTTVDLDLYTADRRQTSEELLTAGARWDAAKREHVLDGVRIHTVTPDDAGHKVERTSVIDGVRVVSLKDLIAIKLICGAQQPRSLQAHRRRRRVDPCDSARQAIRGQAATRTAGVLQFARRWRPCRQTHEW